MIGVKTARHVGIADLNAVRAANTAVAAVEVTVTGAAIVNNALTVMVSAATAPAVVRVTAIGATTASSAAIAAIRIAAKELPIWGD